MQSALGSTTRNSRSLSAVRRGKIRDIRLRILRETWIWRGFEGKARGSRLSSLRWFSIYFAGLVSFSRSTRVALSS